MQGRVGLGADLAEDQHDESQHARTDGDPFLAVSAKHDDRDQSRGEVVDEVIAEQDQTD
jgi:hypothetical protein